MVSAVIYVPVGQPLDAAFARQCLDHCVRRGYHVHTIHRDWPAVLDALRAGNATVVVMVPSHWTPKPRNRRFIGSEETVTLEWRKQQAGGWVNQRSIGSAVTMSIEEVRDLIDGNPGIPSGLDPETIAAARRLWAHFDQCGDGRKSRYETARLLPRGDDGGFAERFLEDRRDS